MTSLLVAVRIEEFLPVCCCSQLWLADQGPGLPETSNTETTSDRRSCWCGNMGDAFEMECVVYIDIICIYLYVACVFTYAYIHTKYIRNYFDWQHLIYSLVKLYRWAQISKGSFRGHKKAIWDLCYLLFMFFFKRKMQWRKAAFKQGDVRYPHMYPR